MLIDKTHKNKSSLGSSVIFKSVKGTLIPKSLKTIGPEHTLCPEGMRNLAARLWCQAEEFEFIS